MAAAPASNPPALSEPKSSKKNKKAKNETVPNVSKPSAQSPTPEPEAGAAIVDIAGEGNDGQYESPYMKELYK